MGRSSFDGEGLLAAFRAGVANLEEHVEEINGLNVFPVPDGDTGSNMLATIRAALEEAERAGEGATADRVAGAFAFGALMGARGNSGVITSQILRGFAEALEGRRHINGLDLAHALREGSRTAYGAVARPVEGTILTVIREAAEAAVVRAEDSGDVEAVLTTVVEEAERSVARTPSLLPILREAGVVDSGGQGLYRFFQGVLLFQVDRAPAAEAAHRPLGEPARASALVAHADEGFGYETMFLLQARPSERLDVDAILTYLSSIGDSVLVAGDARAVKIHVHNERPDQVIGYGLAQGALSRITVENLDHQARDVREARAADFTGVEQLTPRAPDQEHNGRDLTGSSAEPAIAGARLGVVAVAAGDGLRKVFEQFAVPGHLAVRVVVGGQAQNPSTGELVEAVASVAADEVLILPNNPNVVMAARQTVELSHRSVVVVPTRNAAEGVAALLALDPALDAEANVEPMTRAGRAIQSIQVTRAVRDARIGDRKVKRGQTICLDPDDGLIAADGDQMRAVLAGVDAFAPGFELVTLYYGDGADLDEAEEVARRVGLAVDGAEVQLLHGGQPHYRYLISAE